MIGWRIAVRFPAWSNCVTVDSSIGCRSDTIAEWDGLGRLKSAELVLFRRILLHLWKDVAADELQLHIVDVGVLYLFIQNLLVQKAFDELHF